MIGYISGQILSIDNDSSKEYLRLVVSVAQSQFVGQSATHFAEHEAQLQSAAKNVAQNLTISQIGYVILVARDNHTSSLLVNSHQAFWINYVVREDSTTLYGFIDDADRKLFEQLTAVSGIGPKIALAMFSTLKRNDILQAVQSDDLTTLAKTPGLGKKGASKIILDLKGKLVMFDENKLDVNAQPSAESGKYTNQKTQNKEFDKLVSALVNLGFRKSDATDAAICAVEEHLKKPVNKQNISEALRLSLQMLKS